MRSHPAQPPGEGSDGPPTIEWNGSERGGGAVSSSSLRFLSPTRGTEGVVKTIERSGFLFFPEVSVPYKGNRRGRKDY